MARERERRQVSVVELRARSSAIPLGPNERLVALLESATQLVRSATHDLRTPLAAIAMAAQGAKRRPECQVAARGLDRIVRSCERIDSMLTDLAAAGRLELATAEPEQQAVECSRFVPDLLSRLSDRLDAGRVRLVVAARLPPVRVDPKQFEQILEIALTTVLGSSSDDGQTVVEVKAADSWVEVGVSVARPSTVPEHSAGAPGPEESGREALSSQAQALKLLLLRVLVEANGGAVRVDGVPGAPTGLRLRLVPAATEEEPVL
jgi:two-component system sensor histidine kinase KdpD